MVLRSRLNGLAGFNPSTISRTYPRGMDFVFHRAGGAGRIKIERGTAGQTKVFLGIVKIEDWLLGENRWMSGTFINLYRLGVHLQKVWCKIQVLKSFVLNREKKRKGIVHWEVERTGKEQRSEDGGQRSEVSLREGEKVSWDAGTRLHLLL